MNRREFIADLVSRLAVRRIAEVGTRACELAEYMSQLPGVEVVYAIDDWSYWSEEEREQHRGAALKRVAASKSKIRLIEKSSCRAANDFEDFSIDLVYVDADHEYEPVVADLLAWWPKTRVVMAGHDWMLWSPMSTRVVGVVPAVEEFAERAGRKIRIDGRATSLGERMRVAYFASLEVKCEDEIPSWYIIK